MDCRPLLVEIIRRLWDRGLYIDNPWFHRVHDNYFDLWVDWRTAKTMESVDAQTTDLTEDPEIPAPIYWEDTEGPTPLGGPMRLHNEFTDDNP